MPAVAFFVTLLLDVRAHIPNQPSFGPDPANILFGTLLVRAIVAFFVAIAFLSVVLCLIIRQ